MREHQEIAIKNHCRFAFETAQPKFRYILAVAPVSIVLSVNSGYE
jgi:hypothetical protein